MSERSRIDTARKRTIIYRDKKKRRKNRPIINIADRDVSFIVKRRRREILKTLLFVGANFMRARSCFRDSNPVDIELIYPYPCAFRGKSESEQKRGKESPFCVSDIKSEVLERLRSGIHISYGSRRIRSREREKDETGRVVHGASETRPSIFQIVASEQRG